MTSLRCCSGRVDRMSFDRLEDVLTEYKREQASKEAHTHRLNLLGEHLVHGWQKSLQPILGEMRQMLASVGIQDVGFGAIDAKERLLSIHFAKGARDFELRFRIKDTGKAEARITGTLASFKSAAIDVPADGAFPEDKVKEVLAGAVAFILRN